MELNYSGEHQDGMDERDDTSRISERGFRTIVLDQPIVDFAYRDTQLYILYKVWGVLFFSNWYLFLSWGSHISSNVL